MMGKKFTECSIWEKTDVIDLPILPFGERKTIKSKILNDSAKYIKRVKNANVREKDLERSLKNERRFIFYEADTLIGIDVSALDASFKSYLDEFFFLLKMYPLVLINSYLPKKILTGVNLNTYCLEHYYILPVFGPIPFHDKALSGEFYGEKIVSLLKGEKEYIDFKELKDQNLPSIDTLKTRFPQFKVEDEKVYFVPDIVWLGVNDVAIEKLLNYLFNNNMDRFNYKEMCKKFQIEKTKLLLYISKSMLFYQKDKKDEEVIFRLHRKNIYWGFVCKLADQFERELIERDAICYDLRINHSIGTIKNIDEKIYHKLGNLFCKFDSFAYKMFSYIQRILDSYIYTEIVVVDNGNMKSIISTLRNNINPDKIFEIIDYFGTAIRLPQVNYQKLKGANVLVIIDVINTGRLLNSVIDILNEVGCNKIGVFSFIVNHGFNIESISSKIPIDFSYITEKKLNSIDDILEREYTKRFDEDKDLNFKLLWGTIGKSFILEKDPKPLTRYVEDDDRYWDFCQYRFNLVQNVDSHSYIYQKLKRLIRNKNIVLVYREYNKLFELLQQISVNEYDLKIELDHFEESNMGKVIDKYANKKVIFIIPRRELLRIYSKIARFIKVNKIADAEFLNLVEYELYSLDKDLRVDKSDDKCRYIFHSRLNRYIGKADNPQFGYFNSAT